MQNATTMSKKHAKTGTREVKPSPRASDVPSKGAFSDVTRVLELSPRDQMIVAETLLNPRPLNEAMKRALRERLADMYGPEK